MSEVREALWKGPNYTMECGYILRRTDHAVLVQRKGYNEQFWIHYRELVMVFG